MRPKLSRTAWFVAFMALPLCACDDNAADDDSSNDDIVGGDGGGNDDPCADFGLRDLEINGNDLLSSTPQVVGDELSVTLVFDRSLADEQSFGMPMRVYHGTIEDLGGLGSEISLVVTDVGDDGFKGEPEDPMTAGMYTLELAHTIRAEDGCVYAGEHNFPFELLNDIGITDGGGGDDPGDGGGNPEPQPVPPVTQLDSGPNALMDSHEATFTFSCNQEGCIFYCSLDGSADEPCTSPHTYTDVAPGEHGFRVWSSDATGTAGGHTESWTWKVLANTTIARAPQATTNDTSARFEFNDDSDDAYFFECRLDAGEWWPCTSPRAYAYLEPGMPHSFEVRVTDPAGDVEPSPAQHSWTISADGTFRLDTLDGPCGKKSDGSAWCWNQPSAPQLGTCGREQDSQSSVCWGDDTAAPGHQFGLVAQEDGLSPGCEVLEDGRLWGHPNGWVLNTTYEQIGTETDWAVATCGCAIKTNGTLWCWGNNWGGEVGDGTDTYRDLPVQVGTDTDWVAVDRSPNHGCALKSNGTVWCWGSNARGQLGDGTDTIRHLSPVQFGTDSDYERLFVSERRSCAQKTDKTLWCSGHLLVSEGSDIELVRSPTDFGDGAAWAKVSGWGTHICGIKADGTLWCWGSDNYGRLGTGTYEDRLTPTQVGSDSDWVDVDSTAWLHGICAYTCEADYTTCGLKTDGTLWCWGWRAPDITTGHSANALLPHRVGSPGEWTAVDAGSGRTCGLKTDGTLWCWGWPTVGDGTDKSAQLPVQVGSHTDWETPLSVGLTASCAHRRGAESGRWCWGGNASMGTGTRSTHTELSPVRADLHFWDRLVMGRHGCGIRGGLFCWGTDTDGQVGMSGASSIVYEPIEPSLSTYVDPEGDWRALPTFSVAVGDWHTCAIKSPGTLWWWGGRGYGEQWRPLQIGTDEDWATVVAGGNLCCTLKADDTLWCEGDYAGLQQVGSETWSAVDMGSSHLCGIKPDGTLWCWGSNGVGQLGNGSLDSSDVPVQVGSGNNWAALSLGGGHSCAVTSTGDAYCWGGNGSGEVGNGKAWSATPLMVE